MQPLLQHLGVLVMNLEGDRLPSRDLGTRLLRARGTGRSGSRWGAKASQPAEGVLQRPRGEADPRHLLRLERTECKNGYDSSQALRLSF